MEKSQITFFENQILESGRNLLKQYPTNVFALQLVLKFLMEQSFGRFIDGVSGSVNLFKISCQQREP